MSKGHFQCVQTIRVSEPTRIGSVKMDHVNGPLEGFHYSILSLAFVHYPIRMYRLDFRPVGKILTTEWMITLKTAASLLWNYLL